MIYKLNSKLILASGSPRRKELLSDSGFSFDIHSSDVDESIFCGEKPAELVQRLARAKAEAVAGKFPDCYVLGADTDVALGSRIFGKPADKEQAIEMLEALSGNTHQVLGAVCLLNTAESRIFSCLSVTEVTFRNIPQNEIKAYVGTSEPYDKAGAYAAQGIGATFISSIKGSYTNVVGLDLAAVIELFGKAGILEV